MSTVTGVRLAIGRAANISGNVVVRLHQLGDYDTNPTIELTSSTINANTWTINDFNEKTFTFDTPVTITESGYYAISIDLSAITAGYRYLIEYRPASDWFDATGSEPYEGTEGNLFKYENSTWSTATGSWYYILKSNDTGFNWNQAISMGSTLNFSDVTGITVQRAFRVYLLLPSAEELSGTITGQSSVTGEINPKPRKPTTPAPVDTATTVTLDQSTVGWAKGSPEGYPDETYSVYYGQTAGSLTLVSTEQSTLAFTVSGIDYGSPFDYAISRSWRIDATNENGTTTGDTWSFTTISFASPKPSGATTWNSTTQQWSGTLTGGNNMITVKRFVGIANNRIWYET